MLDKLIPIEDVLYVFESWILMVRAELATTLECENKVFLFNAQKEVIGKAILNKFLVSRNLKITPIEIALIESPENLKKVKFISKIN